MKPYRWNLRNETLLELPVTTMPVFRTPIHFSYLTYLGIYSKALALAYLGFAVLMCKATGTEPSLLLHPLDFMGKEDDSDLANFPGMQLPLERKLELMDAFVGTLLRTFEPVTMGAHVDSLFSNLPRRELLPTFSS